jgi:hypothetical protein
VRERRSLRVRRDAAERHTELLVTARTVGHERMQSCSKSAIAVAVVALMLVAGSRRGWAGTLFDVGVAPPVSLFGWQSHKSVYGLDVAVAYDRPWNAYGLAVTGGWLHIDHDAGGIVISGFATVIGDSNLSWELATGHNRAAPPSSAHALMVSGFYNAAHADFTGIQLSAGKNVLTGISAHAIQASVFKNESLADFTGLQAAVFVNEASGLELAGLQIAGVLNWSESEVTSALVVGAVNLDWGKFRGVQLGAFNKVSDSDKVRHADPLGFDPFGDVSGIQIGLVNIGGWVRGAQIGVVNFASSLSGLQIGAINITGGNRSLAFFPGLNPGFASRRK